jgi:hypothetical protein
MLQEKGGGRAGGHFEGGWVGGGPGVLTVLQPRQLERARSGQGISGTVYPKRNLQCLPQALQQASHAVAAEPQVSHDAVLNLQFARRSSWLAVMSRLVS